jgi:hypothetical protein
MPITVQRDEKRRLITATATGRLTVDEGFRFLEEYWVTAGADYAILLDSRDMIVDQTASDVRALVSRVERHSDTVRARFAIVVGADITADHAFGMARMYEMLLETAGISGVRVFRSVADAEAWLGIEPL